MRVPLRVVAPGLLLGAGLALTGVMIAPRALAPAVTTTTTTRPVRATAPWYHTHETVIGSSVIVLDGLTVQDGTATLRYQVLTIAPRPSGIVILDQDGEGPGPGVAPEGWVIETTDGEYRGTSRNTAAREVRFELDERFMLDKVTGIRITSYGMRVPYGYDLGLPSVVGTTIDLDDGYTLSIDRVVAQSTSVVFHLGFVKPVDEFTSTDPNPVSVNGVGPEWTFANAMAFGGTALTRQGSEVPDPLMLRVRSAYWVLFDRTVPLDIGGLSLG